MDQGNIISSEVSDILAIKNGDANAFEIVYGRLHVKLYRFLLKKTRSGDIAKEVTQLTFIRLWMFRHTLSEAYTIDTQVFTIARTTLFNYLRDKATEKKHIASPSDLVDLRDSFLPADGYSAGGAPLYSRLLEASDELRVAIEGLPPVRKKVFILSRMDGLSNKEIAGYLSISVKTVEDHISKATRYLRSVITS